MSNKWNDKIDPRVLKFSYIALCNKFGDRIVALTKELADLYGYDSDDIYAVLTQQFEGTSDRILLRDLSYKQIDEFFEKKIQQDLAERKKRDYGDSARTVIPFPSPDTRAEIACKDELDARPPHNMYDDLKKMFGKNTNDVMTAYGDAKCLSMIFVKRMLKDSRCEVFLDDVIIHYLSFVAKAAGLKPPYFWQVKRNVPVNFPVIDKFLADICNKGMTDVANTIAWNYLRSKSNNDHFIRGGVFS